MISEYFKAIPYVLHTAGPDCSAQPWSRYRSSYYNGCLLELMLLILEKELYIEEQEETLNVSSFNPGLVGQHLPRDMRQPNKMLHIFWFLFVVSFTYPHPAPTARAKRAGYDK